MTATIQKILKPTKYRAVDTSTSEQIVGEQLLGDPSFDTNVSGGAAGTYWACDVVQDPEYGSDSGNDGVSITGGKAVWANNGSDAQRRLQERVTGPFLDLSARYRITITISDYTDGGIRVVSGSYYGDYLTAAGTYIIDFSPLTGGGNLQIDGNADADLKVSEVSLYKLESFVNNNHGNIYSGRALEFDGVSDYLTTGYGSGLNPYTTPVTVSFWGNVNADSLFFGTTVGTNQRFYGGVKSGNWDLGLQAAGWAGAVATGALPLANNNTWYRVVYVLSAGVATVYVNGVSTFTKNYTSFTFNDNFTIGDNSTSLSSEAIDGMCSDFQIWDAAWTQSDVTYDYLNPESLALNNSGTSLTESNLKLWYPMQDGHRGQQFYILDGANVGLGPEILSEGDFSSSYTPAYGGSTNWTNSVDGNTAWTIANGVATRDGSADNSGIDQANVFENGKFYRVSYSISNRTQGSLTLYRGQGTQLISSDNSNGDFVYYFTSGGASKLLVNGVSNFDGSVDNISVKEVLNTQKNHATSVFYGDELITSDYADNGTFTNDNGNWAVYDPESTSAITINTWDAANGNSGGGLKFTISGTSTEIQGVQLGTGYFDTLVAGRTYRVSIDMRSGHVSNTDDWAIGLGGGVSANFNITTSFATYTKDIVATSDAALLVYNVNAGNNRPAYIDNVSIKEIGIASGWTDADQQLDIPQTALQSYNQLAWFPGTDSGTDFDINCGKDSTIDDIFDGGGTVCAWIYPAAETTQWIVHKGAGTGPSSGWYINIQNLGASSDKFILRLDVSFDGNNGTWTTGNIIPRGKWSHIAVNWNDDSVDNNPSMFVNGESVVVSESSEPSGTYDTDDTKDFLIGNSHDGTKPFGGAITEVSLWDTGLSKAQVGELYNDGKALDALTHSLASSNLKAYWRNNGLATWKDLKNSNDGTVNNVSETILIPAGVDSSRDAQGFIMNRQKDTNALNLPEEPSGVRGSSVSGPYVWVPKAPVPNASSTVTNFSLAFWMKLTSNPTDILSSTQGVRVFDDSQSTSKQGLRVQINHNNILYTYVTWGSSASESIYTDFALGNLNNSTVTNPHSFGTDGEWNGTQTDMDGNVGINQYPNGPVDEWIHYAVTFDHDREESQTTNIGDHTSNGAWEAGNPNNLTNRAPFYVFVNGIIVAKEGKEADDNQATAASREMQAGNNPMMIGNDMNTAGNGVGTSGATFPGYIDDLLFYSDTLTAKEVLRIYNAGKRSHR